VVATGTIESRFQFDSIRYVPGASVILDNATVLVDANDTQIKYGHRWRSFRDLGMQTTANGSMMTIDFIGGLRFFFQIFLLIFCRCSNNMGIGIVLKFAKDCCAVLD
jgi:hypothetical protein